MEVGRVKECGLEIILVSHGLPHQMTTNGMVENNTVIGFVSPSPTGGCRFLMKVSVGHRPQRLLERKIPTAFRFLDL